LPDSVSSFKEIAFYQDFMFLFSIRLIYHEPVDAEDDFRLAGKSVPLSNRSVWKEMKKINERFSQIKEITNFTFPEANVLFVYPVETITSLDSEEGEALFDSVHRLIGTLVSRGIQLDVISSSLLKDCRLSSEYLYIHGRKYEAVVYPCPEVLDPKALEILSLLDKMKFPLFLGGKHPEWTTRGKRIPHTFPIQFDPGSKDLSGLLGGMDELPRRKQKSTKETSDDHPKSPGMHLPPASGGIHRLFRMPDNALGTLIQKSDELLFLLHPEKPGGSFKGKIQYGEIAFEVPKSSNLTIFRKRKNKPVEKVF
jgi:hypothetical protein